MSNKIRKKEEMNINVYEASLDRLETIFKRFDNVNVWFSGGKDSTVMLNLALIVAKALNKLPLKTVFIDEEAIHPPTIDYMERTMRDKAVDLDWYCLEIEHRNACSNQYPHWYTWDKTKEDLWVRPLPTFKSVVTDHPKFKKGMSVPEFGAVMHDRKKEGQVCQLLGLRAQESIRRYRVVANKKHDNYITAMEGRSNVFRAFPIYDWTTEDIWIAPQKFKWDYNTTYDIFEMAGMPQSKQRVCPPYGEEPLRGLWIYAQCFPEMWHKMLARVPGCATAWRYANTELYSVGNITKPDNISWKDYLPTVLSMYPFKERNQISANINRLIMQHAKKSKDPIHETIPHIITGISWQFLCKVVIRGDLKGRISQNMMAMGSKEAFLKSKNKSTNEDFGKTRLYE